MATRPEPVVPSLNRSSEGADFAVLCEPHGEVEVAAVRGEIDIHTLPQVREAIESCISGGRGPVVVDYTEVSFMDSSGLRLLVECRNLLGAQQRRFGVAAGNTMVRRIIEIAGMEQLLELEASREAAINAVTSDRQT